MFTTRANNPKTEKSVDWSKVQWISKRRLSETADDLLTHWTNPKDTVLALLSTSNWRIKSKAVELYYLTTGYYNVFLKSLGCIFYVSLKCLLYVSWMFERRLMKHRRFTMLMQLNNLKYILYISTSFVLIWAVYTTTWLLDWSFLAMINFQNNEKNICSHTLTRFLKLLYQLSFVELNDRKQITVELYAWLFKLVLPSKD